MKWFKLDSNFLNDNRVIECSYELGQESILLYLKLLCLFAQQYNGEKEKTFIIHETNLLGIGVQYRSKLFRILPQLCSIFAITYTKIGNSLHFQYPKFLKKQASYFRGVCNESRTNRIEENRIEKNKPPLPPKGPVLDFEKIWELYPNKDGKKEAMRHFKASVKNEDDYNYIFLALENYLSSEPVKKGFIKKGSTWFNNWKDWVEYTPPSKGKENNKALVENILTVARSKGYSNPDAGYALLSEVEKEIVSKAKGFRGIGQVEKDKVFSYLLAIANDLT